MRRLFPIPFFGPVGVPPRLAGALLLVGWMVMGMAHASPALDFDTSLNAPGAANAWPRLFYTPAQRAAMVRARQSKETVQVAREGTEDNPEPEPPPPTFVLQGMAQGRLGASAWINGVMLRQGDVLDGRTLRIEQHTVRLRQAGKPDLVLKPGQSSLEPEQPVLDVVPPGTFIKR